MTKGQDPNPTNMDKIFSSKQTATQLLVMGYEMLNTSGINLPPTSCKQKEKTGA
jgi:hypothetical protein